MAARFQFGSIGLSCTALLAIGGLGQDEVVRVERIAASPLRRQSHSHVVLQVHCTIVLVPSCRTIGSAENGKATARMDSQSAPSPFTVAAELA